MLPKKRGGGFKFTFLYVNLGKCMLQKRGRGYMFLILSLKRNNFNVRRLAVPMLHVMLFSYNHVQNNISDFCDFIAIHRSNLPILIKQIIIKIRTLNVHTRPINING